MANTTTKKEFFAMVSEIVSASQHARKADILKFVAREVELLDKKHSKNADKKFASTVDTKAAIIEVLTENGKPMTISEMLQDERLATFSEGENKQAMSNQRLSAIVKQLVDKGTVTRIEEKKKAYFSC